MATDLTALPPTSLVLGSLDLAGTLPLEDGQPYRIGVVGSDGGTSWGNPEAVVAEVVSQLLDGEIATITGFGNREIPISLIVEPVDAGADDAGDALAQGEAALVAQIPDGTWRNTITWQPTVPGAQPCVWDVIYGHLEHTLDDLDETLEKRRTYTLTLDCFPWARPAQQTLISAIPNPSSSAAAIASSTVDDCTAIGSWQPFANTTISLDSTGGGVRGKADNSRYAGLYRVAAIPADPQRPFLRIGGRMWFNYTDTDGNKINGTIKIHLDNSPVEVTPISYQLTAGGYWSAVLYVPDGVASVLSVAAWAARDNHNDFAVVQVNDLTLLGTTGYSGTSRQQARTIPVIGSCRTEAAIEVKSLDADGAATPLGVRTMVYTAPASNGFVAPLRADYRTAGQPITADTAAISGAVSTLGAVNEEWQIPANTLPAGTYQLIARLRATAPGAQGFTTTATTGLDDDATLSDGASATDTVTVDFAYGNTWDIYQIAELDLPTLKVDPESTATLTVTLAAANADVVDLDEAWLVRVGEDGCAVSLVDTSGDGVSKLVIKPASVAEPLPSMWVGHADDDTHDIAVGTRVIWWGSHQFKPGPVTVFTVTSESDTAVTSLRYYERYHTHVASTVLPAGASRVDEQASA